MTKYRIVLMLPAFLIMPWQLKAQQNSGIPASGQEEKTAVELFGREKYGASRNLYSKLTPASELMIAFDAEKDYYVSASAAGLQHGDAAVLLKEFLEKYPENTRTNRTWFRLGNLYFRNNSYSSAMDAYEKVHKHDLSKEERAELTFKTGYCLLRKKDVEKAADAFASIKDQQTRYTGPATYYYGHIMYEKGLYETALRDFEKIRNDETFKSVVPYYIIQIYYLQGRHEEMMELAQPYLKGQRNKRTNEILRLAADVSYRKGDYKQAISYMEEYRKVNRNKVTREENYVLGYAYYKTAAYDKAIPEFQLVTGPEDSLSQNAYYHLADSYLQTGQKQFASNSFLSAWKLPMRTAIAEDALFNYAKLSIELSYNPYNEAIKALQQYLEEYPASPRRDEAYTYLANLYLVTKNYREALLTLENVKKRNARQNEFYQKITYFRALELFADNQHADAIDMFKRSLENKSDASITAGATYWMAESYYRSGQYDQAVTGYRNFQALPAAQKHPAFAAVSYNLGYARIKQKNYAEARKEFQKYIDSRPSDTKMLNDAKLRLADSYFMMKQYTEATAMYDQVAAVRGADADYALYQKSLAMGVTGNSSAKISSLQKLVSDFPRSQFNDDARFELGQAQMSAGRNEEALQTYQKLVADHPNSSFVKRALLNTGLIYYNTNREKQALDVLKKVVKDYPASAEAKEGLAIIRNIYVDMNQVDQYVKYAADIPFANVTVSEQDSLTYQAIETRYMSGDCQRSASDFTAYLNKFPNGIFAVNAHFYKADCDAKAGRTEDALNSYNFILNRPRTKFTENAALRAADLNFKKQDFTRALALYEKLEENAENPANLHQAYLGQMRCNAKLGNHGIALQQGQRLLATDRLTPDILAETHLTLGNSAFALQRYEMAKSSYEQTLKSGRGEMAAEALYGLASISYNLKDYKTAEKHIFKLSGDYASYDYWVAKAFILLADVYLATGNEFQARQTLQSIVDNYEGEDLRNQASQKLDLLNRAGATKPSAGSSFDDEEGIIIR